MLASVLVTVSVNLWVASCVDPYEALGIDPALIFPLAVIFTCSVAWSMRVPVFAVSCWIAPVSVWVAGLRVYLHPLTIC